MHSAPRLPLNCCQWTANQLEVHGVATQACINDPCLVESKGRVACTDDDIAQLHRVRLQTAGLPSQWRATLVATSPIVQIHVHLSGPRYPRPAWEAQPFVDFLDSSSGHVEHRECPQISGFDVLTHGFEYLVMHQA